jgi:lipopolysaccharide transport system ATP-binding protein
VRTQEQVVKKPIFFSYFDATLISTSVFRYPEKGAGIGNPRLLTKDGEIVNQILRGERYELTCDVNFEAHCPGVRFWALIRTPKGIDLAGCSHPILGQPGIDISAGTRLTFAAPFVCSLNPGTYFCNFAVQAVDGSLHHRIVDAMAFRVVANDQRPTTGLVDVGYEPVCRLVL